MCEIMLRVNRIGLMRGFRLRASIRIEEPPLPFEGSLLLEPDIKVIDDPSLMTTGGDPQLDSAIQLMLTEIKNSRAVPQPNAP